VAKTGFRPATMLPATRLLAYLPLIAAALGKVTKLQDALYNGTVTAEDIAGSGSLDGYKLSPYVNLTSYQW
jgi:hypothetical protein